MSGNFLEDVDIGLPLKSRCRGFGGGRKVLASPVRDQLFEWFIDVRTALKARLPKSLFMGMAKHFYDIWRAQNPNSNEPELKFTSRWFKKWKFDYNVSLKCPNKRYSIRYVSYKIFITIKKV